jgi:hypothetical protein
MAFPGDSINPDDVWLAHNVHPSVLPDYLAARTEYARLFNIFCQWAIDLIERAHKDYSKEFYELRRYQHEHIGVTGNTLDKRRQILLAKTELRAISWQLGFMLIGTHIAVFAYDALCSMIVWDHLRPGHTCRCGRLLASYYERCHHLVNGRHSSCVCVIVTVGNTADKPVNNERTIKKLIMSMQCIYIGHDASQDITAENTVYQMYLMIFLYHLYHLIVNQLMHSCCHQYQR